MENVITSYSIHYTKLYEGRWTVLEAIEEQVSSPIITLSLMQRFRSRKGETFSDKVIAGLRREFGGHSIKEE